MRYIYIRIVCEGDFFQRFLKLALKDVYVFIKDVYVFMNERV